MINSEVIAIHCSTYDDDYDEAYVLEEDSEDPRSQVDDSSLEVEQHLEVDAAPG